MIGYSALNSGSTKEDLENEFLFYNIVIVYATLDSIHFYVAHMCRMKGASVYCIAFKACWLIYRRIRICFSGVLISNNINIAQAISCHPRSEE
jgi:hypothetical protein